MDLGIRGKKAIVCASSKGLGRGCAIALAEAGVDLVINGRNAELLAKTAQEIREKFGVEVIEIAGDVSKPEVQKALLAACPPIELIQAVIDGMAKRGFGRIVNITSLSVYVPIPGLDLSSGARAGLTSFLAGVARTVIDRNVTINSLLPGKLDTDRLRGPHEAGTPEDPAAAAARKA
ncbi:MAG: SDR family NAD(P)-dependent oxidoreductase, partial [Mesorhizobium sp.]